MNVLAARVHGKLYALISAEYRFGEAPDTQTLARILIDRLTAGEDWWDRVAAELRIGRISQRTRSEVLRMLEHHASLDLSGDPFAGFPKY